MSTVNDDENFDLQHPLLETGQCNDRAARQLPHASLEEEEEVTQTSSTALSRPLMLLFGLNGLTECLQTLALAYVINTRVAIPLPYLPTYGAISFLPWSLKPLYAYLISIINNQIGVPRQYVLVLLLFGSGASTFGTSFIKPDGVLLCFILGFVRGVTDAWAEFCLGLSLVDQARRESWPQEPRGRHGDGDERQSMRPISNCEDSYETLAALFQSQAATARNVGSLVGGISSCLVLIYRRIYFSSSPQLSGSVADALLLMTAILIFAGSLVAWKYGEEFRQFSSTRNTLIMTTTMTSTNTVDLQQEMGDNGIVDEETPLFDDQPSYSCSSGPCCRDTETTEDPGEEDEVEASIPSTISPMPTFLHRSNLILVVILQLALVLFSLKDPIVNISSHYVWKVMLVSILFALVIAVISSIVLQFQASQRSWQKFDMYFAGVFLILRHALPSHTMIFGSFLYSVFYSAPMVLQLLSLTGYGMMTISSWSYSRFLSCHTGGWKFKAIIVGTTVLATLMALSYILLIRAVESVTSDQSDDHNQRVSRSLIIVALLVRVGTAFADELQFLPDVVLATTSVKLEHEAETFQQETRSMVDEDGTLTEDAAQASTQVRQQECDSVGIRYGTLISCINFGDQLGALLTGPLVAILGITRENGWFHLDIFLLVCCGCNVLSLMFLGLVRK